MRDPGDMFEIMGQVLVVRAEQGAGRKRAHGGRAHAAGEITHLADGFGRFDVGNVSTGSIHFSPVDLDLTRGEDIERRFRHVLRYELLADVHGHFAEAAA